MSRGLWAFLEGAATAAVYLWAGLPDERTIVGALLVQTLVFFAALGCMAGFGGRVEDVAYLWLTQGRAAAPALAVTGGLQVALIGIIGAWLGGEVRRTVFGALLLICGLTLLERVAHGAEEE